jgi:hypothetical protein
MLRRMSLIFCAALPLLAQSGLPTITGEVKQNYQRTKDLVLRAADKMPEDGYAMKATPQVRSYAQILLHIAQGQEMICGGIFNQPGRADQTKTAKADVIAELKKSFDICDRAYDFLGESNASLVGGSEFMGGTMVGRLYANVIHDNEMYGTMVVYLRIRGIVPPSSETRNSR